jgi:hypothetical protein
VNLPAARTFKPRPPPITHHLIDFRRDQAWVKEVTKHQESKCLEKRRVQDFNLRKVLGGHWIRGYRTRDGLAYKFPKWSHLT